jgi:hypothetical protein
LHSHFTFNNAGIQEWQERRKSQEKSQRDPTKEVMDSMPVTMSQQWVMHTSDNAYCNAEILTADEKSEVLCTVQKKKQKKKKVLTFLFPFLLL